MGPGPDRYRAAESLKADGNTYFQKGKYAAAIERYTEAITLCPDLPVLYVNRAMCHKKRGDWPRVAEDTQQALRLNSSLLKAHYLRGLAFYEETLYTQATSHLQKALEAARESNDSIKDEIWHELARAKYAQWQQQAAQRKSHIQQLHAQLPADLSSSESWGAFFKAAVKQDEPQEAPSVFVCPLTLEVYRDPVIALPSGLSYERSALLEHLQKVGCFCPITRKPMTADNIVGNQALQAAVQHYLDEHPWAWGECI